jgi:hypothetical protein
MKINKSAKLFQAIGLMSDTAVTEADELTIAGAQPIIPDMKPNIKQNLRRVPFFAPMAAGFALIAICAGLLLHFLAPVTEDPLPVSTIRGLPVTVTDHVVNMGTFAFVGRTPDFFDVFSPYGRGQDSQIRIIETHPAPKFHYEFHVVIAQVESAESQSVAFCRGEGGGYTAEYQTSNLRVLETVHGTAAFETFTLSTVMSNRSLREGGVYVLPIWEVYPLEDDTQREYRLIGSEYALFEIDDAGKTFSHSIFADLIYFDGKDYLELVSEIKRMWKNSDLVFAVSDRGWQMRNTPILEAQISPQYTDSDFFSQVRYYDAEVVQTFNALQVTESLQLMVNEYNPPLWDDWGNEFLFFENPNQRHLISAIADAERDKHWLLGHYAFIEDDVIMSVFSNFSGNLFSFYSGKTLDALRADIERANRFAESEIREFVESFRRDVSNNNEAIPLHETEVPFRSFYYTLDLFQGSRRPPVEPELLQRLVTNFPGTHTINSAAQLREFRDEYGSIITQHGIGFDGSGDWVPEVFNHNEDFFSEHFLLFVLVQEPHRGNVHNLERVTATSDGLRIYGDRRISDEWDSDVQHWIIVLEMSKEFAQSAEKTTVLWTDVFPNPCTDVCITAQLGECVSAHQQQLCELLEGREDFGDYDFWCGNECCRCIRNCAEWYTGSDGVLRYKHTEGNSHVHIDESFIAMMRNPYRLNFPETVNFSLWLAPGEEYLEFMERENVHSANQPRLGDLLSQANIIRNTPFVRDYQLLESGALCRRGTEGDRVLVMSTLNITADADLLAKFTADERVEAIRWYGSTWCCLHCSGEYE